MCFTLNKCCFCVTLNVGAKIISVLSLVSVLLAVAVYGGAALFLPMTQSKQTFYILVVGATVCQAVFCAILVYGTFWNKPSYLWPWLVVSWIYCGGLVLLSVLGVVLLTLHYYDDVETYTEINSMSSFYFIYAVILYYCTTIVNSRREEMMRQEEVESAERLMRPRDMPKSLLV